MTFRGGLLEVVRTLPSSLAASAGTGSRAAKLLSVARNVLLSICESSYQVEITFLYSHLSATVKSPSRGFALHPPFGSVRLVEFKAKFFHHRSSFILTLSSTRAHCSRKSLHLMRVLFSLRLRFLPAAARGVKATLASAWTAKPSPTRRGLRTSILAAATSSMRRATIACIASISTPCALKVRQGRNPKPAMRITSKQS